MKSYIEDGRMLVATTHDVPVHAAAGSPPVCPVEGCGDEIQGTLEVTHSVAYAGVDDSGAVCHQGETESDYIWDNQTTVYFDVGGDSLPVLVCMQGHNFTHADVTTVG